MLYACGNTLVVDTDDVAKYVNYERGQAVKCVVLDGTVFHKAGLITGGVSGARGSGKRWEEKEVLGLKGRRDELIRELKDIQSERRGNGAGILEGLRDSLGRVQTELGECRSDLKKIESRIASLDTEIAHIDARIDALEPQAEAALQVVNKHQAEIEEVRVEIREVQDEVFEPFCEAYEFENVREYEARRFRHDAQEMEGRAAFNTQKAKLSSL
jgi:structural maintenance of chromosome 1